MNSTKLQGPFLPTMSSGREGMEDMEVVDAMISFCENAYCHWFGEDREGYMILPDFTSPEYQSEWYFITLTSRSLDLFHVTLPPTLSQLLDICRVYANRAGATRFATLLSFHVEDVGPMMLLRLESKYHRPTLAVWKEKDGVLCFLGTSDDVRDFTDFDPRPKTL